MIHDAHTYFQKAWKERWTILANEDVELMQEYGVDCERLAKVYGFKVEKVVIEDMHHNKKGKKEE